MLAKFETKSSRVKGISFHPTRPWILCSLHDGQIQLWDYRTKTLLETFTEHDGPVRSVDFHPSQPLFVSGGDDYKIRVWNYNNKRSLFTLMGHLDYIRTVQFHPENPWIVSCSDDQNIRIWNWQSRECIAVLTGHNHYVMSAQFHPKEDLVVSASLDQTIRVWDISGLKQKGKKTPGKAPGPSSMISRLGTDLVGTVKYVLEGHERGVNWASFHPELPLIVSGSDDRMIKIWRTNDTKAWEVDTLRGHTNNVSCVMFHPREDLILSDSEDHSIRVWDSTKRIGIQSFVRAHDRFWIITAHKTQNLIAAGHDSGAVVFKLRRERTPFAVNKNYCFYVKDRYYRLRELEGERRDVVLLPITRGPAASNNAARSLQLSPYCTSEFVLLMHNEEDGGSYEVITCSPRVLSEKATPDLKSGAALSACFVSRTKFATLEGKDSLFLRNMDNIVTKRVTLPVSSCRRIFPGGVSGRVLLSCDDQLALFDTASLQVVGMIAIPAVKRVCWSPDNAMVAVCDGSTVRVLSKELAQLCAVTEKMRVKSCVWDEHGVLLYSTLAQIKYCLPSGECGIVRSLDEPVYIAAYCKGRAVAFTRDAAVVEIEIDPTEYLFKYYLEKKHYREAIRIIRTSRIDSHAIISYLQKNGFEDIALYFVTEPRARFNLAIRCGNLDSAIECAAQLNEPAIWNQLAEEALRQGNRNVVETCYQRTKSLGKLSFLYTITGNLEKLRKMLQITEKCGDVMGRFCNALYLNDVEARIAVLLDAGQLSLAYVTAKTHGCEEVAARIASKLEEGGIPLPDVAAPAELLAPPLPVNEEAEWPMLEMPRSAFDRVMEEEARGEPEPDAAQELAAEFESVASAEGVESGANGANGANGADRANGEWAAEDSDLDLDDEAGGWGDDLDLSDEEPEAKASLVDTSVPQPGRTASSAWCANSSLIYDHAASGDVDSTFQLLNRQLGVVRFASLGAVLTSCYCSVQAATAGFPGMPALPTPLQRCTGSGSLPMAVYRMQHAAQLVKLGLKCFQVGRFEDALGAFRSFFLVLPVIVVESKEEEAALRQFADMAREYVEAALLQLAHSRERDLTRNLCLAYYMTQCRLQSAHQLLALNNAMVAAFKAENFIDAAVFAKRILVNADIKSPRNAALEQKARKVLVKSEREGRNAVDTGYNDQTPFVLDCVALTPIFRGEEVLKCPLCGATYRAESKNGTCSVCELAQIGLDTVGLVCRNAQK